MLSKFFVLNIIGQSTEIQMLQLLQQKFKLKKKIKKKLSIEFRLRWIKIFFYCFNAVFYDNTILEHILNKLNRMSFLFVFLKSLNTISLILIFVPIMYKHMPSWHYCIIIYSYYDITNIILKPKIRKYYLNRPINNITIFRCALHSLFIQILPSVCILDFK